MKDFIRNIIISLFFCSNLSGQTINLTGIINDNTGKPLEMANIMVLNHFFGTTSDSNGYFELTVPQSLKNDTVVFSYMGYHSKHICICDLKNKITLKPLVILLPEVYVQADSIQLSKQIIVNKFKKRKCYIKYSADSVNNKFWIPFRPKQPTIEAIYFPFNNNYKNKKIKEIRLYLSTFIIPSLFRLRIFSANKNRKPDYDLLTEPVEIKVKKNRSLVTINLEKYDLTFNKNGIFVGIELLVIPENKSTFKYDSVEYTIYSPYLNYINTRDKGLSWIYSAGKWTKDESIAPLFDKRNKKMYYKPAITLLLY